MAPDQMGIQESFRWIMRSIIIVCGLALFIVVEWQASKWWSNKRILGEVEEVVCVCQDETPLSQEYWQDFFSFWLLPHQRLHPYQLRLLEKKLKDSGYFETLQLSLDNSQLWVRYRLSAPLAKVGDESLCLYPNAHVQKSLLPLPCDLIHLVGIESWNQAWPLESASEVTQFLEILQKHPLFKDCRVDAKDWRAQTDPASEFIVYFPKEAQSKWMRVGSVHFKEKQMLLPKLEKAHELMKRKGARLVDLRLESVVVLGYEENPSEVAGAVR